MNDANKEKKRVTCKRPHPNPLFKEWLESLYYDAVKEKSSLEPALKEALTSLSKYPLPLKTGAECAILKGFDRGLCQFLDMHLNELGDCDKRAKVGDNRDEENKPSENGCTHTQLSQSQDPTRSESTSSPAEVVTKKNRKKSKKLVTNSQKCPLTSTFEESSKTEIPENDANLNFNTFPMSINNNCILKTMPCVDNTNHPYTYNVDKDGVVCIQCDLSAGAKKKDTEKQTPRKLYKPAHRSGGYAILVALMEQRKECPYRECLTKEELMQKAQKHCDTSFTEPKPQTDYTAWINAKRLMNKGLLQVLRCPSTHEDVYMLTELGRIVGAELMKKSKNEVTINDIIFHGQPNDRVPSLEDVVISPPPLPVLDEVQSIDPVFIEMPYTTFEIILLIDKNESQSFSMGKKHDSSVSLFSKYTSFKHEYRSLKVGDFTWIARSKKTGHELVLPYVIERKRLDDFGASIKDGRFHEQKFRLKKCGLKNVIYLVECYGSNKNAGLPMSTLTQAMINTCVQDGLLVHKTDSLCHTVRFIAMVTQRLFHKLQYVFLRGCNRDTNGKELMTFEFFNKSASKTKPLTVREMFLKMLLQLKGLSVDKALAITNKYSTPKLLMNAYDKCTEKEGEMLLANLKVNNFSRNVGPSVSKTIYKLFTKLEI